MGIVAITDPLGDSDLTQVMCLWSLLVFLGFRTIEEMEPVAKLLQQLWKDESGQDIAEYAVMLAVILVIVVGTIRLIGSNANNVFSQVGSAIQ
jgi:Flp pilus assembly pilin Flp